MGFLRGDSSKKYHIQRLVALLVCKFYVMMKSLIFYDWIIHRNMLAFVNCRDICAIKLFWKRVSLVHDFR